jgi:hypothetical protein
MNKWAMAQRRNGWVAAVAAEEGPRQRVRPGQVGPGEETAAQTAALTAVARVHTRRGEARRGATMSWPRLRSCCLSVGLLSPNFAHAGWRACLFTSTRTLPLLPLPYLRPGRGETAAPISFLLTHYTKTPSLPAAPLPLSLPLSRTHPHPHTPPSARCLAPARLPTSSLAFWSVVPRTALPCPASLQRALRSLGFPCHPLGRFS